MATVIGNSTKKQLGRWVDYGSYRFKRWKKITAKYRWEGKEPPVDILSAAKTYGDLALVSATAQFEDGIAQYVWQYETAESAGGGRSGGYGGGKGYTLEGSLNKDPITMHPKFGEWMSYENNGRKYGRVVGGEVIWEVEDPNDNYSRSGLTKEGNFVFNMNPYYGLKDFYSVTGMWIVEEVIPLQNLTNLLHGIGKIGQVNSSGKNSLNLKSNSGAKELGSEGGNWLYAGVSVTQVGNRFLARRSWLQSGPGGWEPILYT